MAEPTTPNNEIENNELGTNEPMVPPEELHEHIKKAVNKLGPQFSKDQKKEFAKLMVKIFEKGISPKEAMNIPEEEIAQIYSFAYSKFNAGQYGDARELFKMLMTLEPLSPDFATALGICHHKLKDYEYASICYMLGGILDMSSPVCFFYAYDCFVNMKDDGGAGVMLCNVIARCGDLPMYDHIRKDATLRLDALKLRIEQKDSLEKQIAQNQTS